MDRRVTKHYHNNVPQESLAISIKERIDSLADKIEKQCGSNTLVQELLELLDSREGYLRCNQIEELKKILHYDLAKELSAIQIFLRAEEKLEQALFLKQKDIAIQRIQKLPVISPRFVRIILTKIYEDERNHEDIEVMYGKLEKYDRDDERNVMVIKAGYLIQMEKFRIADHTEE